MHLLVYFSEDYTEADVAALRAFVPSLAACRDWTVAPPRFIDDTDASSCSAPDDEPIRTVGVLLDVHVRAQRQPTPREEVRALIDAMCSFSRDHGADMEVELGDTYAGEIRRGVANESVEVGLIATW